MLYEKLNRIKMYYNLDAMRPLNIIYECFRQYVKDILHKAVQDAGIELQPVTMPKVPQQLNVNYFGPRSLPMFNPERQVGVLEPPNTEVLTAAIFKSINQTERTKSLELVEVSTLSV